MTLQPLYPRFALFGLTFAPCWRCLHVIHLPLHVRPILRAPSFVFYRYSIGRFDDVRRLRIIPETFDTHNQIPDINETVPLVRVGQRIILVDELSYESSQSPADAVCQVPEGYLKKSRTSS